MHNTVALETNPTSGTCCANFKNVVSATSEEPGWGLYWGLRWVFGGPEAGDAQLSLPSC